MVCIYCFKRLHISHQHYADDQGHTYCGVPGSCGRHWPR